MADCSSSGHGHVRKTGLKKDLNNMMEAYAITTIKMAGIAFHSAIGLDLGLGMPAGPEECQRTPEEPVIASHGASHIVSRSGVFTSISASVRDLQHRLVVPSFLFVAFWVCSLSSPKMMTKRAIDGSSHVFGWQPASSRVFANWRSDLAQASFHFLAPAASVTQHLKAQAVSRQISRQQVRKILNLRQAVFWRNFCSRVSV